MNSKNDVFRENFTLTTTKIFSKPLENLYLPNFRHWDKKRFYKKCETSSALQVHESFWPNWPFSFPSA